MMLVVTMRLVLAGLLVPSALATANLHGENKLARRQLQGVFDGYLKSLFKITPKPAPTTIDDTQSILNGVQAAAPKGPQKLLYKAEKLLENGFLRGGGDLKSLMATWKTGFHSSNNSASALPTRPVYPGDAPYSVPEVLLRAAIVIPPTFTFGKKPPTILIPGTGSTAFAVYQSNYVKLLAASDFGDPLWVNIPDNMLGDIQGNAEYIAYAINYVSALTSKNVSVISWSQGGPATQWALKYWPSTRSAVADHVSFSPDFHGTTEAYLLCVGLNLLGCTAAVIQQEYTSLFIATLRGQGGDSAYVPTTTIYSESDDIVQPQTGVGASAFLLDARNVGVTNIDIQQTCPGNAPAGGSIDHQGTLYNALGYAAVADALTHPGPASLRRIHTTTVCQEKIAPGLTTLDMQEVESYIIILLLNVLTNPFKVIVEPPIRLYALTGGKLW